MNVPRFPHGPAALGLTLTLMFVMTGCKSDDPPPPPPPPPLPPPVAPGPLPAPLPSLGATYSINNITRAQVVTDAAVFGHGEQFRIVLAVPRDSYVYLFNQNTDGTADVLFPTLLGGANPVRAGVPVQIPPEGRGPLAFGPPAGREITTLVVSDGPVPQLDRLLATTAGGVNRRLPPGQLAATLRDLETSGKMFASFRKDVLPDRVTLTLDNARPGSALVHELKLEHR